MDKKKNGLVSYTHALGRVGVICRKCTTLPTRGSFSLIPWRFHLSENLRLLQSFSFKISFEASKRVHSELCMALNKRGTLPASVYISRVSRTNWNVAYYMERCDEAGARTFIYDYWQHEKQNETTRGFSKGYYI